MSGSRQSYTESQLKEYRKSIENNGVTSAVEFYDDLYANGYNYAGWAVGVARNDTVTGKSATDFMINTAKQGVGGRTPQSLSTANINAIKKDMALGYVDALIANAEETDGVTNQDVDYEQTRSFHKDAFEANGLGIENWTLETPMNVIKGFEGEDFVESRWLILRETGGDGPDSLYRSDALYQRMVRVVQTPSWTLTEEQIELQQQAREWLNTVGSRFSKQNFKNVTDAILNISSKQKTPIGGAKLSKLMAISIVPSFNYTNSKRTSVSGFTLTQTLDNAESGASKTNFNSQPAYLLTQTLQASCKGDEAGWAGGVKSGTVGKEVKPTSGSGTIIVEGKLLVRSGDTCTMNNANVKGQYILA